MAIADVFFEIYYLTAWSTRCPTIATTCQHLLHLKFNFQLICLHIYIISFLNNPALYTQSQVLYSTDAQLARYLSILVSDIGMGSGIWSMDNRTHSSPDMDCNKVHTYRKGRMDRVLYTDRRGYSRDHKVRTDRKVSTDCMTTVHSKAHMIHKGRRGCMGHTVRRGYMGHMVRRVGTVRLVGMVHTDRRGHKGQSGNHMSRSNRNRDKTFWAV